MRPTPPLNPRDPRLHAFLKEREQTPITQAASAMGRLGAASRIGADRLRVAAMTAKLREELGR